MPDVYVPLGLVERKKISKNQYDVTPDKGSKLYEEMEITQKFDNKEFLEQVLKQKNTPKSKGKRIAIIGEPGAGKTTLLQKIVDYLSKEINQSIIIWISLADLQGEKLEKYLFDTWLTAASQRIGQAEATDHMKNDFVTQFNKSRVWLLLDGLDEMSSNSGHVLADIHRQIRQSGCINQARIVLTCRLNLWDGGSNALNDFDTYRTLDFSYPEQVEKFVDNWFTAISEPDRERGKRLCNTLKESGKERIRDLVKNPLRLTLLCLNWQAREGKLPDTQAGFYQQLVDDFYKWKQDEFVTKAAQRQQLNIKLGELAREAIDKEATRFRLRGEFINQFLGDVDDENSLLSLALKLGWLNKVGEDTDKKSVYAFFYASFQEYFAATAIDEWDFFLPRNHKNKPVKNQQYRIFEPQWKQAILLWLGRHNIDKDKKEEFINALVKFQDGCGKWRSKDVDKGFYEYQTYFLAAAGVAEFRDYSKTEEIVNQIVKWEFSDYINKQQQFVQFLNPIVHEANKVVQQTDRKRAIAALVNLSQQENLADKNFRLIAYNLGQIGSDNELAIQTLVGLLKFINIDGYIFKEVIESLGKIASGNEQAIKAMENILSSKNKNNQSSVLVAYILGKINTHNEQAISTLLDLLISQHSSNFIRCYAAEIISEISIGNEQIKSVLLTLLDLPNLDVEAYRLIAQNLGEIDPDNEQAITKLVNILASKNLDKSIRLSAAGSLQKIGVGNQKVISALLVLLESNNVDEYTLALAAKSLGIIAYGNQKVISGLVALLELDNDEYTILQIAESLGLIGYSDQTAIAALVKLLTFTSIGKSICAKAIKSLGIIGYGNQVAITALETLIESKDVNQYILWQASESLGKIHPGNNQAILVLEKLLLSNSLDEYWCLRVAESLEEINPGNEKAIMQVRSIVLNTVNTGIIQRGVESLKKIGNGKETAINALVNLLDSQQAERIICCSVIECLSKIGNGNEKTITVLMNLVNSEELDNLCRKLVVYSLKEVLQNNQLTKVVTDLKDYLNSSHRFEYNYSVIWHCAQNMPYPDFYQAWHQPFFATRLVQSIKSIFKF
ncbi:HEAT repeat domain-containing protein [Anabaena sp. WFMT]|uniref:HEAT repeat domain-containing protein n=1 Tax=Anabaena sp. WFMT TaxID=3449730 RepID=UPI003F1E638B